MFEFIPTSHIHIYKVWLANMYTYETVISLKKVHLWHGAGISVSDYRRNRNKV